MKVHASLNEKAKQGDVDLVFLGDSITEGWNDAGKDVWAKFYGARKALNLGISGDRTQHVLWRLDNGNIAGIQPKLAVVMIGTNNYSDNTAEEIAAGIKATVEKLRAKLPETKVLLLGIFPRDDKRNETRDKFAQVNQTIAKLDDQKFVYFLDIGPKFLLPDGSLSKEAMPDLLHPEAKGFEIWAEAIEPQVVKLLGEKK